MPALRLPSSMETGKILSNKMVSSTNPTSLLEKRKETLHTAPGGWSFFGFLMHRMTFSYFTFLGACSFVLFWLFLGEAGINYSLLSCST